MVNMLALTPVDVNNDKGWFASVELTFVDRLVPCEQRQSLPAVAAFELR
jgi:hypothetical protein